MNKNCFHFRELLRDELVSEVKALNIKYELALQEAQAGAKDAFSVYFKKLEDFRRTKRMIEALKSTKKGENLKFLNI